MIRTEVTFDYVRFSAVIAFPDVFPSEVKKAAKTAFNKRIRVGFLSSLRKTPKRRYWTKDDWSSDAQRRAFFAKTGGAPYVRTGKLQKAEQIRIEENGNTVLFGSSNPTPYDKWVKGDRQVRGHKRTGWNRRTDIYTDWRPRATDAIIQGINEMMKARLR